MRNTTAIIADTDAIADAIADTIADTIAIVSSIIIRIRGRCDRAERTGSIVPEDFADMLTMKIRGRVEIIEILVSIFCNK